MQNQNKKYKKDELSEIFADTFRLQSYRQSLINKESNNANDSQNRDLVALMNEGSYSVKVKSMHFIFYIFYKCLLFFVFVVFVFSMVFLKKGKKIIKHIVSSKS